MNEFYFTDMILPFLDKEKEVMDEDLFKIKSKCNFFQKDKKKLI